MYEKRKAPRDVFALDKHGERLDPTTRKHAYKLLKRGRAVMHKRYPFTIRITDLEKKDVIVHDFALKIDPGSKTTGVAIVMIKSPEDSKTVVAPREPLSASPEAKGPPEPLASSPETIEGGFDPAKAPGESPGPAWDKAQVVVAFYELEHRGDKIHLAMIARNQARRRRRSAKLRYRPPRFNNRRRKEGWLPPSVKHRVDSVAALMKKFLPLAHFVAVVIEDCKFDTQALMNPDISGLEYQLGKLYKKTKKGYLLKTRGNRCSYCGATGGSLEIDHVIPVSKNGSDRVSNLTLACPSCNQLKGNRDLDEFLADDPELLKKIKAELEAPLRDAAVMNSVRHELRERLEALGVPVYGASAFDTKFNRERFGVPKYHAGDAACVGPMASLEGWNQTRCQGIKCMGRGHRRMEQSDKFGFPRKPRAIRSRRKRVKGFATGDLVRGIATRGKYKGAHVGRVTAPSSGQFYIKKDIVTIKDGVELKEKVKITFSAKRTKLIQRGDGYAYSTRIPPTIDEDGR